MEILQQILNVLIIQFIYNVIKDIKFNFNKKGG
jgi:hypothetical protein